MLHLAESLTKSPRRIPMPDCGVVVFESRHAPGFVGDLQDSYAKFHLVVAGRARWECEQQLHPVSANQLVHIVSQVPHHQEDLPGDPVTLYAIHYRPDVLSAELVDALAQASLLAIDLGRMGTEQARRVRAMVREMLFEQETRRIGWEALLIARLTEIAVATLRLARRLNGSTKVSEDSASRVARYVGRLKTEFYASGTLDDAARSVGLSRRRFTELFREVAGDSWRNHVRQLRLKYAAQLLTATRRSVTAIAFECGFEDLSHFNHSFKKSYGLAPMAYRQAASSPPMPAAQASAGHAAARRNCVTGC